MPSAKPRQNAINATTWRKLRAYGDPEGVVPPWLEVPEKAN